MPDIAPILARLNRAQAGFESVVRALPVEAWRKSPQPGAWSAAEVVGHLTMVEQTITERAARLVDKSPKRVPLWKRFHIPVRLVEWRVVRRKTPIPLDSTLVGERDEMLGRLAEARRNTVRLLEETRARDLSAYRWPHPFFGSLNLYDWFRVIAHHEVRHTKQIREIVEIFQK